MELCRTDGGKIDTRVRSSQMVFLPIDQELEDVPMRIKRKASAATKIPLANFETLQIQRYGEPVNGQHVSPKSPFLSLCASHAAALTHACTRCTRVFTPTHTHTHTHPPTPTHTHTHIHTHTHTYTRSQVHIFIWHRLSTPCSRIASKYRTHKYLVRIFIIPMSIRCTAKCAV
jgi:hypothetical protein